MSTSLDDHVRQQLLLSNARRENWYHNYSLLVFSSSQPQACLMLPDTRNTPELKVFSNTLCTTDQQVIGATLAVSQLSKGVDLAPNYGPGLPTREEYLLVEQSYLQSVHPNKIKRQLIDHKLYDLIVQALRNEHPKQKDINRLATSLLNSFELDRAFGDYVLICGGRPVAVKEELYELLCHFHLQCQHGSWKQTYWALNRFYAKVPAKLVELFIKSCPTCALKDLAAIRMCSSSFESTYIQGTSLATSAYVSGTIVDSFCASRDPGPIDDWQLYKIDDEDLKDYFSGDCEDPHNVWPLHLNPVALSVPSDSDIPTYEHLLSASISNTPMDNVPSNELPNFRALLKSCQLESIPSRPPVAVALRPLVVPEEPIRHSTDVWHLLDSAMGTDDCT